MKGLSKAVTANDLMSRPHFKPYVTIRLLCSLEQSVHRITIEIVLGDVQVRPKDSADYARECTNDQVFVRTSSDVDFGTSCAEKSTSSGEGQRGHHCEGPECAEYSGLYIIAGWNRTSQASVSQLIHL